MVDSMNDNELMDRQMNIKMNLNVSGINWMNIEATQLKIHFEIIFMIE